MADYRIEFPDFPEADMPAIPAGFVDSSYRNDPCPCFINETTGLCIWVDYLDPEMRETPDLGRFVVTRLAYGSDVGWQHDASDPVLETDDWQAVVAFVAPPAAEPDWRALCAALLPYAESRAEDMSETQAELERNPDGLTPAEVAEAGAFVVQAWEAVEAARAALARTAR